MGVFDFRVDGCATYLGREPIESLVEWVHVVEWGESAIPMAHIDQDTQRATVLYPPM